jgi:hypothetical protein
MWTKFRNSHSHCLHTVLSKREIRPKQKSLKIFKCRLKIWTGRSSWFIFIMNITTVLFFFPILLLTVFYVENNFCQPHFLHRNGFDTWLQLVPSLVKCNINLYFWSTYWCNISRCVLFYMLRLKSNINVVLLQKTKPQSVSAIGRGRGERGKSRTLISLSHSHTHAHTHTNTNTRIQGSEEQ